MKKFVMIAVGGRKYERVEADELKIEGGAAIFLNAKSGKITYERLVKPLSQLVFVGENPSPDPEGVDASEK